VKERISRKTVSTVKVTQLRMRREGNYEWFRGVFRLHFFYASQLLRQLRIYNTVCCGGLDVLILFIGVYFILVKPSLCYVPES
jgi:hypothetical protein